MRAVLALLVVGWRQRRDSRTPTPWVTHTLSSDASTWTLSVATWTFSGDSGGRFSRLQRTSVTSLSSPSALRRPGALLAAPVVSLLVVVVSLLAVVEEVLVVEQMEMQTTVTVKMMGMHHHRRMNLLTPALQQLPLRWPARRSPKAETHQVTHPHYSLTSVRLWDALSFTRTAGKVHNTRY